MKGHFKPHSEESKLKMSNSHKGHKAWNKGLTKYDHEGLMTLSKKQSENLKGCEAWNQTTDNPEAKRIRQYTIKHFEKDKDCLFCNGTDKLEFHHLKYEFPPKKEDSITVCNSCHNKLHWIFKHTEIKSQAEAIFKELDKYNCSFPHANPSFWISDYNKIKKKFLQK